MLVTECVVRVQGFVQIPDKTNFHISSGAGRGAGPETIWCTPV